MTKELNGRWRSWTAVRRARALGSSAPLPLAAAAVLALSCDPQGPIRVTNTVDGDAGSLRAALTRANARATTTTIELGAGEYRLDECGSDDTNAAGDLDVTTNAAVTIAAMAPGVVIRQTCDGERVLDARGTGRLTLEGVTITGGSIVGTATEPALGGAIRAKGDVALEDATVSGNTAKAYVGTLPADAVAARGGGLYVEGSLSAVGATLSGNVATGGAEPAQPLNFANVAFNGIVEGGAAYVAGAITVTGGTLADNRALASVFGTVRGGALAQASSSTAAVSVTGTTLTNNVAQGGFGGPNGVAGSASGGAVAGARTLTVTDVTASGNQAVGGTTDRMEGFGGTPGAARGGAFASSGVASVSGSTFSANRAQSGNAFVYCRLFTCTSAAPANSALGGGVWSDGALTLTDSVFEGNRATQGGGSSAAIGSGGGAAAGSGDVTVTGGRYTGNSATGRGGAIQGARVEIRDVELTGNSAGSIWYTNLLGAVGSGGAVHAATLTAERLTATGNTVTGIGGGALSVSGDATIRSSSVRDNVVNHHRPWVGRQGGGGGISVAGSLDISDSAVIGNHGSASPDPTSNECYPFGCATSFLGGGIWAGSVTGRNLTVANNLALGVSWDVPSSNIRTVSGGGGLAVTGAASLLNTTVSGNRVSVPPPTIAYLPARGAAVFAGALTLDHSTIDDNDAVNVVLPSMLATAARVPFPSLDAGSLVTTRSAAIAPADSTVCVAGTGVAGPSASSYNWFSDTSCALAGAGDHQAAASFFLGALAESGGSVPVRVPGASSVLVDAIPLAACSSEPDARGVTRPQGPACDIGAVEAVPIPGLGAADLALSFRQPGTVVPGQDLVLELTLANRGPNASAPVIEIQPPPTVRVQSASVAGGPTCAVAATVSCVWTSALAANTNVVVTIQARPDSGATEPLVWTARAIAPEPVPPIEDDTVTLTVPVAPKAGLNIVHWHGNSDAFH